MDAIRCAWNKKKTPLLIDATATDRDDPKPTPLDEFFGGAYRGMDAQMSYSGKGRYEFLDLKQCVLDVSLKKAQQSSCAKDWSTVQRELRQRVVKSMQDGDGSGCSAVTMQHVSDTLQHAPPNLQQQHASVLGCRAIPREPDPQLTRDVSYMCNVCYSACVADGDSVPSAALEHLPSRLLSSRPPRLQKGAVCPRT